jgi:hypothetical protein
MKGQLLPHKQKPQAAQEADARLMPAIDPADLHGHGH